ncbi:MAG: TetR family transcriptional regulator [Pseudonocardiaceae bacterium]|nr:TetR family transcriptional regulator [Pseudonocardiaceae bacterium]
MTRTARKRAQRMQQLERSAAKIFAERGYEGANFEEIAAQLDLRGPSLYHYFSSKEELFLRCVRTCWEEVMGRLEEIAGSDRDAVDILRSLFREQVFIELRDYPEFVPLFLRVQVPIPAIRAELHELRRSHEAVFKRVAGAVQRERGLDASQARVWLLVAFGALSYLQEWYDPAGPTGIDQLADMIAETLVDPFRR